ncbi:CRISPR-associated exonuclease, Cas4 family [Desulforamulus reducens MI-1]|uniref:CRISPR-associated exonuclease Cas4 n=1 Tax=Desulforamulus reducens (strain ATCC BAA-1160 / DSM 100696 / MI-1) TaxID=349161 RepID=A4J388_DESRM|nr:CRISPR-associated protein Cas4 [Desulforamulus reducens]ABO49541.1 CRISPR-associated exonuclease, Cas4 family [Desulforamulus reducens MI-1]
MEKLYEEDDLLALSGIQHFAFCERQWGLIHVESQWVENVKTVEGKNMHKRVDDPYFTETRGDVKIVRSVPLMSKTLGLYGVADVIEIQQHDDNFGIVNYSIVEYKRGKPKADDRDQVQLCAQALCLEEMLAITINYGYLFYGETKHRYRVEFNNCLRTRVQELAQRMHLLFEKGQTPPAVYNKKCKNCSLFDICVPELSKVNKRTQKYLSRVFDDMRIE